MTAEQAAVGVAEIVDENMANAARVHAVERGVAIAERTLVAFGGAAPLHASRLAEKLGIARIIVPPDAGVGSAVGFLAAPAAYEIVRSRYMRLDTFDAEAADALIAAMQREAETHARAAASGRPISVRKSAFMRYAGQGHEISVALPDRTLVARRRRHLPGRLRARVHAPLRPLHPQRRDRDHELGRAGDDGDGAARAPRRGRAARPAPTPIGERSVFDARPRPPPRRAGLRAHRPGARRDPEGPRPHRRGRHLHLRLAPLRRLRRRRRRPGAYAKPLRTRAFRPTWNRRHIRHTCHPGTCCRDPHFSLLRRLRMDGSR